MELMRGKKRGASSDNEELKVQKTKVCHVAKAAGFTGGLESGVELFTRGRKTAASSENEEPEACPVPSMISNNNGQTG